MCARNGPRDFPAQRMETTDAHRRHASQNNLSHGRGQDPLALFLRLPGAWRAGVFPDDPDPASPAASAAPSAPAAPAKGKGEGRVPIGVGVKVSTLGIGGEVGLGLTRRSNVRVGFNAFSYGHTFGKDRVTSKGTPHLPSLPPTYHPFLLGAFLS